MIVTSLLLSALLVLLGLGLLAFALLAPAREGPTERIRWLERMARTPRGARAVRLALEDPDPQVAAVAAVLLRDAAATRGDTGR
jgi:hypothetical protein